MSILLSTPAKSSASPAFSAAVGVDPKTSGEIRVKGVAVEIANPRDAIAHGLALVPEDRLRQGLVLEHSVETNACVSLLDRLSAWYFVSKAKAAAAADRQIEA